MSAANDLYSKGNEAFVEEDYKAAVDLYSKAIELDATVADYFTHRAHAHLKVNNYQECKADADKAVELGAKNAKLCLRRGIACFNLGQFQEAKDCLTEGKSLEDTDKSFDQWLKKCDTELDKISIEKCDTQLKAESDKATSELSSGDGVALLQQTPVPAKVKHDWYQTEPLVVVTILLKNLRQEDVSINITDNSLDCTVKLGNDKDYNLDLQLAHPVVSSQCTWKVYATKIEIRLKKAEGIHWPSLEASKTEQGNLKHFTPESVPDTFTNASTYPSSSTKKKDWDKIVTEIKKEESEENPEGDAAVNQLFQKIYSEGSDEVKKAMNKSFTESGGTVLSTNWKDIGLKKVDIKPPDGMEWKNWDL